MPVTRSRAAASAACGRRTWSAGTWRTTSASPASTPGMRWCSAATTTCPARGRSSAAGAPTGCCRSTAARRRRSTARWPPGGHRAAMRWSSATRTRAATTWTSSTTRRRLPTRTRWRRSGRPTSARSAATRSQVTGPPLRQLDFGIARQFRVFGDRRIEVRAESFNLTNTPSFNLPGSLNFLDARNFASITAMRNTPRQFQLGAKLYWWERTARRSGDRGFL